MDSSDGVFYVGADELVAMPAVPYDAEADLQRLLETHPDLLAGGLIDPDEPRRWLLVGREHGLPATEGGRDVWSVDHLFLDQDAIPTIVEVKRSTNTQIRRNVVGQMFDYAANGVRYWPVDKLRSNLATRLTGEGETQREIARLLDRETVAEWEVENFWRQVADNLRSGRLRLLFVADEIPPSLQRIIEFLNEQMAQTEVLGLAIQQYSAAGRRVLIPRLVGRMAATPPKGPLTGPGYDELLRSAGAAANEVAVKLEQLAKDYSWQFATSRAARQFQDHDGATLCSIYPGWGGVQFHLGGLHDAGMVTEYNTLHGGLSALAGKQVANRSPQIAFDCLLAQWPEFQNRWLPAYIAAWRTARKSGRTLGSY